MTERILLRTVFWGFVAIVVLAPLPYGAAHLWSYSLLALIVAILVALWALAAFLGPGAYATPAAHTWYLAALVVPVLAWMGLQACPAVPAALVHPLWTDTRAALGDAVAGTISLDPDATLIGLMRIASYAGVFWLAVQTCRDGRRAYIALWAFAAAGLGYAVYGLWVFLSGSDTILFAEKWAYQLSLTSTFVNRNHYALYAGFGLIASFGLMLRYARRDASGALDSPFGIFYALENLSLPVFVLFVNCAVIGTALLMTQSRGGLAFAAIGLVSVIVMMSGGRGEETGMRKRSLLFLLVGLVVAGIMLVAISGDLFLQRIMSNPGAGARDAIHDLTMDAIAAAPLTGHGIGTFPSIFHLFRDETFPAISPAFSAAHSVYLEFAAEAGLVAAALYFTAIGLVIFNCLLGPWRRRRHIVFPAVAGGCGILTALHSIYDFGPQIPGAAIIFAALLGIGYAHAWPTDENGEPD